MMIQSIIVDDEKKGAESLALLLKECCQDVSVLAVCHSGKEALVKINALKPDLVFLDIEMPHMNGFELLECIGTVNFKVIFTTAYDTYAIRAFKVNAIDYLLKPIDEDELMKAVAKLQHSSGTDTDSDKLSKLWAQFSNEGKGMNKLAISTLEGVIFHEYSDILRLSSDSNYTIIHLKDGKKVTIAKTLGEYEEMLPPEYFLRIHKGNIINLSFVKRYVRGDGGTIELTDGSLLEVSRRKKNELLERLNIK